MKSILYYKVKSASAAPRTSAAWVAHFRRNAASLLPIPWQRGAELTPAERSAVAASIQGFQLGESAEGKHLYRCAREHAAAAGDPDYAEAVRLFIAEEGRHARDLARFLGLGGVPLIERTAGDSIFRRLRKFGGLEVAVTVLLTPEILALVYYAALREATGSAALRRLCDQILADEAAHVAFQSERLAILRAGRPAPLRLATRAVHAALFAAAAAVVWAGHRRALRAGGYGFARFWREGWREFRAAERIFAQDVRLPKRHP